MSNMGFGIHLFGRMPFTEARSHSGDRAILKWWLQWYIQGSVGAAAPARPMSALDAEALKALVKPGQLSAGIDQPLWPAGPGRVRFRVDVEPQGVSRFAVGRARLIRAPVVHHDSYFVIIRVNSLFHRKVLRATGAYSEVPLNAQCRPI